MVIPVIDIPGSELRVALQIKESEIIPGQPGLYSTSQIFPNSLVAVYTYDNVVTPGDFLKKSDAHRAAINRYAVDAPGNLTFTLNVPVDYAKHPAAAANEPAKDTVANMNMQAEDVSLASGSTYHVVALYSCNAVIETGTELTWTYGKTYQSIRDQEEYTEGGPCASKGELLPSLDEVVQHIVIKRGEGGVKGILLKEDSDSDDDSDSSYGEDRGRKDAQSRRVQPRRTNAIAA